MFGEFPSWMAGRSPPSPSHLSTTPLAKVRWVRDLGEVVHFPSRALLLKGRSPPNPRGATDYLCQIGRREGEIRAALKLKTTRQERRSLCVEPQSQIDPPSEGNIYQDFPSRCAIYSKVYWLKVSPNKVLYSYNCALSESTKTFPYSNRKNCQSLFFY